MNATQTNTPTMAMVIDKLVRKKNCHWLKMALHRFSLHVHWRRWPYCDQFEIKLYFLLSNKSHEIIESNSSLHLMRFAVSSPFACTANTMYETKNCKIRTLSRWMRIRIHFIYIFLLFFLLWFATQKASIDSSSFSLVGIYLPFGTLSPTIPCSIIVKQRRNIVFERQRGNNWVSQIRTIVSEPTEKMVTCNSYMGFIVISRAPDSTFVLQRT